MLKKSKVVALLVVCVMMFAVVEPALAWGNRTGSQTGDAVAYGAGTGAVAAIGAAALIFFTGGLATPLVIGAAAAATAAGAAGGAYYGYNVEEKSLAKDAAVIVGGGVAGAGAVAAAPVVAGAVTTLTGGLTAGEVAGGAAATAGGAAATAGGGAVVEALKSSGVQAVRDNKDNITSSLKAAASTAWQGVSVMGTAYGAYEGVQFLYGLVKPDDDENLKLIKKVDDRIQKLEKEGKKVVLKKVELGDGAYTVFLNTKGKLNDVSPELKRFLDFLGNNEVSEDSYIKELDEKVKEAKANTEWRREYMRLLTIEDEKFAEGRNLGREEGRIDEKRTIYERLISSGKLSPQEASIITGWNVNAVM